MPLLFSYGTLRDAAVQRAVFGREPAAAPDELLGFGSEMIEVQDPEFRATNGSLHRIVRETGRAEDRTAGTVLEVTDDELAMADAYEPPEYRRVEARLASGRRVWVYAESRR